MSVTVGSDAKLSVDDTSLGTLQALAKFPASQLSAEISKSPSRAEEILSPELISQVAEIQYHSWRERKLAGGENDPRLFRDYHELPESERGYIRNLVNGKLSTYVTLITREGIEAMIALGKEGGSLSSLNPEAERRELRFRSHDASESIRETMGRLEHENSLNHYAAKEWVHEWNYEWGEYPKGLEYGYEFSRIQADCDCETLAALPRELTMRLLSLATPADDGRFFLNEGRPAIRSHLIVQPPNAGKQFLERLSTHELVEVIEHLAAHPAGERFYEVHGFLDRFQVGLEDRSIISSLVYGDRGQRAARERITDVIAALTTIEVKELSASAVIQGVTQELAKALAQGDVRQNVISEALRSEWREIFLAQNTQIIAGLPAKAAFFMRWEPPPDEDRCARDTRVADAALSAVLKFSPEILEELRVTGLKMTEVGVYSQKELQRLKRFGGEHSESQRGIASAPFEAGVLLRDGSLVSLSGRVVEALDTGSYFLGEGEKVSPYAFALSLAQMPYTLQLRCAAQLSEAQSYEARQSEGKARISPTARQLISRAALRVEKQEMIVAVREHLSAKARVLLATDFEDCAEVFHRVDGLGREIASPEFKELATQLRAVANARDEVIRTLSIALHTLADVSPYLAAVNENQNDLAHMGGAPDIAGAEYFSRQVRGDLERKWVRYQGVKGETVQRLSDALPKPITVASELITLATLDRSYGALRKLIEPRIISLNHSGSIANEVEVASSGGILVDKFKYDDLATHLTQGNWILVRYHIGREGEESANELDGAFIYNRPGAISPVIEQVVPYGIPISELSFAELFVTAIDRAPGTYQQLLAGMAARLALSGARYSMGTMLEVNQRHSALLEKNNHYHLIGSSVYRDEHKARYIPMLWELP